MLRAMKSIYSPAYRALLAWLRTSRIRQNLSMRDVGRKMGTTHTWIGKVETGERRLDITEYVRLCRTLGVAPAHGLALVEAAMPGVTERPIPRRKR